MEVAKPRLSTPVRRKLTTILASDVESYTRLMRENEEATLRTLSEYREIIDGLIERHDGRIFSTAGDSVLAEFGSTVEAVRCAIAFQEEIAARNAELPVESRLRFRIGLNVGDVMAKGDALYGDGINVAARLEGLAEPGGICVSGTVFEQIKHKLSLGIENMGSQSVKNIAEPISAYKLVSTPIAVQDSPKKPAEPKKAKPEKKRGRFRIPAKKTLAFGLAIAVAVMWFEPGKIPGVTQTCSYMRTATNKIWGYDGSLPPSTLADRVKRQESWGWRLQKLWSRAQKELCYGY